MEIYEAACKAFNEGWDGTPIRHLGVHTSHVTASSDRQIGLFDKMDYERLEWLDKAVDAIRKKYGNDTVVRATFAKTNDEKLKRIEYMSGGISRENRTVDYSKQEII